MVRINGGTVSAIKIDGVVTGITIATGGGEWLPLRAGSTVELTYSVVPTSWVWFPWH
jgi:hypothetical protein